MLQFGQCEISVDTPLIPIKEKRCCLTFRNPKRLQIRRVRVDGCVITDGPRCDYLLINGDSVEHYVELKGSDVRHALVQLEATIKKIGNNCLERRAYIASTQCPMLTTEIQQKKKYFRQHLRASLTIIKRKHEVDV